MQQLQMKTKNEQQGKSLIGKKTFFLFVTVLLLLLPKANELWRVRLLPTPPPPLHSQQQT